MDVDIVVKGFKKKKNSFAIDGYDVFMGYLTSNFILDLIVIIPNIFSG